MPSQAIHPDQAESAVLAGQRSLQSRWISSLSFSASLVAHRNELVVRPAGYRNTTTTRLIVHVSSNHSRRGAH
jgi:hypothetical protein